MLLSIIIPVYNVRSFITPCLESIQALPADQVELLLIDDLGNDKSMRIAKKLLEGRDNVVFLEHEQNRGLSAARNTGLDAASGDYILFLDSDDMLVADAALSLAKYAKDNRLDILQGDYLAFEDGQIPVIQVDSGVFSGLLQGEAAITFLMEGDAYEPMVWQRLYRREFMLAGGLQMEEGMLFEDELFSVQAFMQARRVEIQPKSFYLYRQRSGSIMDSFALSSRWCGDYLHIASHMLDLARQAKLPSCDAALRTRAAAIALSIPKNVVAYHLEGDVRAEVVQFIRKRKKQILAIVKRSPERLHRMQGLLLRLSVSLFFRMYPRFVE